MMKGEHINISGLLARLCCLSSPLLPSISLDMAGRGRAPAHVLRLHDAQPPLIGRLPPHPAALIDDPRVIPLHHPDLPRGLPHPAILLEERLAAQHREIQALLLDNQRLAATHVALKQELNAAQHELRLAAAAAAKAKAQRDAELREMYERSIKMESEARSIDGMRAELAQVRSDVQKLGIVREELVERLQGLGGDMVRAKADLGQVPAIKTEIESMHLEIQRGRAAVEYEKKAHADNLEVSQAMEKNMISMAREVEKLRAELANAEKRARAAAAAAAAANPGPGYAGSYGNPEMSYGASSYADVYGMHQGQSGGGGLQYGPGAVSHNSYDVQRSHIPSRHTDVAVGADVDLPDPPVQLGGFELLADAGEGVAGVEEGDEAGALSRMRKASWSW